MIRIENLSVSKEANGAGYFTGAPRTNNYSIIGLRQLLEINIIKGMLGIIHIKVEHFSMTKEVKKSYIRSPMSNKKSIST